MSEFDLAREYVAASDAAPAAHAAYQKAEGAAAIAHDFYGGASRFTPTRIAFEAAQDARDKAHARWHHAQEDWKRDGVAVLRALLSEVDRLRKEHGG